MDKKSLRRLLATAEKLKAVPHLDEAERILYARHLLATPDERWQMHENYLRALNLFSYFERKKSGFWIEELGVPNGCSLPKCKLTKRHCRSKSRALTLLPSKQR